MDRERLLTAAEVAERMNVTQETVRRWLRSGRLAGRNFGGKMGYRIRERDLEAFIAGDEPGKIAA